MRTGPACSVAGWLAAACRAAAGPEPPARAGRIICDGRRGPRRPGGPNRGLLPRLRLGWVAKLKQRATRGRAAGGGRSRGFEIEVRPTRSAQAPWVGILRYCAEGMPASEAVSEIFRFQAGEWVY
jgi:hypothetical protein